MPTLDFKEIAQANLSNGQQDTFEFFAREFLEMTGYKVLSGPDRGIDGGRDAIVQEERTGVSGSTYINWLVSCKHKAHSGSAVGITDEEDVYDRVIANNCQGFIGFYSTIPSSSFIRKLENLKKNKPNFEFQIFDREKIESTLVRTGPGLGLVQRYFPKSYSKWDKSNHDIDLALLRVGMPQPVAYKIPGDDKVYTLEEIMKKYPQGNQYLFNPFLPFDLILCNNILGITKIIEKDGLKDIPLDYLERLTESINFNIEHMRKEMEKNDAEEKIKDRKRRLKKRLKTKNR